MENHVMLSLSRYDELIEKEKELNKPKKHTILIEDQFKLHCYNRKKVLTDDDAVAAIADQLNESEKLRVDNEYKIELKSSIIRNLKNMSIWEFIKWRKE